MRKPTFAELAVLLAFGLVGCAASSEDGGVAGSEPELTSERTLSFDGSFAESASGPLRMGDKVKVVYDAERLTQCRGDFMGNPGWTITGFWKIGNGRVHTFTAAGHSSSGGADQSFVLDAPGDLQVWFQNTSRWGCSAFDSNLSANYHFTVAPPSE